MIKALTIAALFATPASAQQCGVAVEMSKQLNAKFGEVKVSEGMTAGGKSITQIWANMETGTWTVIALNASGYACLITSGTHWNAFNFEPTGEKL